MKKLLSEELKLRILPDWKEKLRLIASSEGLDISDIGRRAINDFLKKNKRKKPL